MQPENRAGDAIHSATQRSIAVSDPVAHPSRLRTYLPQSLAATFLVLAAPLVVMWVCADVLSLEISTTELMLLTLGLSFVGAAAASHVWDRSSPDAELSFSELMIWSWYRLQKAERRLTTGQNAAQATRSPEEQVQVLHELSDALESKDPYTRGHSKRVERHSFKIGIAMGLPLKDVEVLRTAAALHDVGKIRVPNKILHKPGALTGEERKLIEEHSILGSEMVANTGNDVIVETVRHHHERWDGGGYPDGIEGSAIPLFARIIAVADSYDAITSTRSYRMGASREKAVGILRNESEEQFDPDVVEAFMTTLPARSPIVAAFMFVPGPDAIWRYLKHLLARFGSPGLAPSLGVLTAAVILGAVPVPGLGEVAPEPARLAVAEASLAPLSSVSSYRTYPASSAPDDDRDATASAGAREERRRGAGEQAARSTAGNKRGPNAPVAAAGAPAGDASGSGSSSSGPAGPSAQQGQVVAAPAAPSVPSAPNLSSIDDPSSKGRDCEPGLGKRSKGSTLHCS